MKSKHFFHFSHKVSFVICLRNLQQICQSYTGSFKMLFFINLTNPNQCCFRLKWCYFESNHVHVWRISKKRARFLNFVWINSTRWLKTGMIRINKIKYMCFNLVKFDRLTNNKPASTSVNKVWKMWWPVTDHRRYWFL